MCLADIVVRFSAIHYYKDDDNNSRFEVVVTIYYISIGFQQCLEYVVLNLGISV